MAAIPTGKHRVSQWMWDCNTNGGFLSENKVLVLELAKALRLDEQESRQFLEASLTALSLYWNVPFHRNPLCCSPIAQ